MHKDMQEKILEQERESQQLEVQKALSQLPDEMLIAALQERDIKTDHVGRVVQVARQFSGPLPSPEMLQGYENTHPGLADRIVAMAENEQKHRHQLEAKSVESVISKEKRGQQYALFITCLIIPVSGVLVYLGHPIWAAIYGGVTLASLVGLFLGSQRHSKHKNSKTMTEDELE